MKHLVLSVLAILSITSAKANSETCYQLSTDGRTWSRTPILLCVEKEDSASNKYLLNLRIQYISTDETVASIGNKLRCT